MKPSCNKKRPTNIWMPINAIEITSIKLQEIVAKLSIVKMDFGEAKFVLSRYLNQQLLVVPSERHIGLTFKFHKRNETQYTCASCKQLGKSRQITVKDGRIVGNKHPEDDHHVDCKPVAEESVEIGEIDRAMRADIHQTGKRPRDAYSETLTSISKRFVTSLLENNFSV